MYGFFKNGKVNKELDEIIAQIESNAANNYKDAAQEAVVCLEKRINEFWENMKQGLRGIRGNLRDLRIRTRSRIGVRLA